MVGKNTINLVLEQKHLIFQPAHHIKPAYCSSSVTRTYIKASLILYSKKGITIPFRRHQFKLFVPVKQVENSLCPDACACA
jgi:hypothetical protein